MDSGGNAWVSGPDRIYRIGYDSSFTQCADELEQPGPICNDELFFPSPGLNPGIELDADGNIFVAGAISNRGVYAYLKGTGDYANQGWILDQQPVNRHLGANCPHAEGSGCVENVRAVAVHGNKVYAVGENSRNAFEITLNLDLAAPPPLGQSRNVRDTVVSIRVIFASPVADLTDVDTDADGNGNKCDADYDQNGVVGSSDYGKLVGAYGKTPASPVTSRSWTATATARSGDRISAASRPASTPELPAPRASPVQIR